MENRDLASIIARHDLIYAVIADANGNVKETAGQGDHPGIADLRSALLGPYGDPRNTFSGLEGQILPQAWAQGDVFAFISKPNAGTMVLTFGIREMGPEEAYGLSKTVDADVLALFNKRIERG